MLVGALSVFGGAAAASTGATKDEAVAMVKKAVAHSKTEGPEKESAVHRGNMSIATSTSSSTVLTAWCWLTARTPKRIDTNQLADKDRTARIS